MLGTQYLARRDQGGGRVLQADARAQSRFRRGDVQPGARLPARSAMTTRPSPASSVTCSSTRGRLRALPDGRDLAGSWRHRRRPSRFSAAPSNSIRRWRRPRTRSACWRSEQGDVAAPSALIREALAIKPTVRLAHLQPGADCRAARRHPGGRTRVRRGTEAAPGQLQGRLQPVAAVRSRSGTGEGEIEALKQSIEGNPRFAEGHFFLAKAYLDAGTNLDEAARSARKGLEVAPRVRKRAARALRAGRHLNRQGRPGKRAGGRAGPRPGGAIPGGRWRLTAPVV